MEMELLIHLMFTCLSKNIETFFYISLIEKKTKDCSSKEYKNRRIPRIFIDAV